MKTAIVYLSGSGNTKKLAEAIQKKVSDCVYSGAPDDKALEADRIYVGFWTAKFSCPEPISNFLQKLDGKEVFLFGTAGYNNTDEFYNGILDTVKAFLKPSNKVVGSFMCQGQVSDAKKKALEEADATKYEGMLPKIKEGEGHPNADDLSRLEAKI